nr:DEAD/DEAH box helicase [Nannocystis sp.]
MTPTRELAAQIEESFARYGKHLELWHAVIFGGVSQGPQEKEIKRGIDILVATPGRLLDLMQQRLISLADIQIFVLDEADRMLDMGFLPDVRRVVAALPKVRQTLFFSATMPPEIRELAGSLLRDPVSIAVSPVSSAAEKVAQRVCFVDKDAKRNLLLHVLKAPEVERALVFSRTKHGANRVAEHLHKAGVDGAAIHGNKSQGPARARRRVQVGRAGGAGGDGHRGPRDRRHRGDARDQLRPAERAGDLRAPDRPHGAGRRVGHRGVVLRRRGAAVPGGHRAAARGAHRAGRRPSVPAVAAASGADDARAPRGGGEFGAACAGCSALAAGGWGRWARGWWRWWSAWWWWWWWWSRAALVARCCERSVARVTWHGPARSGSWRG